jgi:aspartyl-tRNA(Asn)/glutamyl-tRNA(Gln) amidotransferase subunit A
VSLAGLPAVSVPVRAGEVDGVRLPTGVQLVGRAWGEADLLRVARALEREVAFAGLDAPRGAGGAP